MKKLAYEDLNSYRNKLSEHKSKIELLTYALNEAQKLAPIKSKELFAQDPKNYFEASFLEKVSQLNVMRLSFAKFCQITETDCSQALRAIKDFQEHPGSVIEPNIEHYRYYAEGRAECEKLELITNFFNAIDELSKVKPINKNMLCSQLQGFVKYDFILGIIPDMNFIKG